MRMKAVSVSLTVWFAQVLSLCALPEDHADLLLTTQEFGISTAITREENLMTKTAPMTTPTTTTKSAEQLMSDETLKLRGFTSSQEDVRRNISISILRHISASTSEVPGHQEPGPGTESTRRNVQDVTKGWTTRRSIQLNHDVQSTSTSWTEDKTRATDGASTNVQPPQIHLTHQTDRTLTHSAAPSPSESSLETLSTKQTSPDVFTNTVIPSGPNRSGDRTATPLHFMHGSTEITEEPLVTTMKRRDWTMQENTEAQTTSSGTVTEDRTNTTWTDELESDTSDTWTTTTTTSKNISTSETETPGGTSATINTPAAAGRSTDVSSREHSTDKHLVSTTKLMDWKTPENTEAQTAQGTMFTNTADTTWFEEAWSTNGGDTWSTNTAASKNISTSETETPQWKNCVLSPQLHRSSNKVCFLTLWTLSMTASVFLGLTVFLWVRLSTRRKRARPRGPGRRNRKGSGPAAKEMESLWAELDSSTEERVEFWYANGATVEEDRRRKRGKRTRTKERDEEDTDMWIQPMVTMKDITEFWYMNGRVRQHEETACEP